MTASPKFATGDIRVFAQSARAGVNAQLPQRLVEFIAATTKTLDGAIYDLRDERVIAALGALAKAKQVRLAVDAGPKKKKKPQPTTGKGGADPKPVGMDALLTKHGLTKKVHKIPEAGKHFMHHKFLIRDGTTLWTGSANFTKGGLELQDNNCLVLRSSQLCARYQAVFNVLWTKSANKPVPSPTGSIDISGARFWPLFEPGTDVEHIEVLLVPYLNHASSVRIMAFELTDPGLLGALQRFQPKNADVKGILDTFQYSKGLAKTITKSAGAFWFMKDSRFARAPSHAFNPDGEQDFMHNKTLILDGTTVITGSYNLSEHAETNAENMLVIESKAVAKFYLSYFDALFAEYKNTPKP